MAYYHEKSAIPVFLCLWSIKLLSSVLLEQNGNIFIGAAELYLDIYSLPYFPLSFLWDIYLQTSKNRRKSMSETQYHNYEKIEKILNNFNSYKYQCFRLPNVCKNCVMMFFPVFSAYFYIFEIQTWCPWKWRLLRYPAQSSS